MTKPPARTTNTINTKTSITGRAQPSRIAVKLRAAIKLRVEQGMVISKACKKAGVSEAGYHKAMLRPAVIAHFEAVQAQFIQTIERRRAGYKARAYEVAAELMERGKNEATRMRAVEFFAGEGKVGTQVNVALSVNPGGYEFVKPGQQVVEIVPSQDSASSEQSSQPIEDAEILPDVGE